jgi:hypothetical protein
VVVFIKCTDNIFGPQSRIVPGILQIFFTLLDNDIRDLETTAGFHHPIQFGKCNFFIGYKVQYAVAGDNINGCIIQWNFLGVTMQWFDIVNTHFPDIVVQLEDVKLSESERDQAVTDLIDLVVAVDGILQVQSEADASYFCMLSERSFSPEERNTIVNGLLRAYRWQYIISGAQEPRFTGILGSLVNEKQGEHITDALSTHV